MTAVKKQTPFLDMLLPKWAEQVNLVDGFTTSVSSCNKHDILITDNLSPKELISAVQQKDAFHIVQENGLDMECEVNTSAHMICDIGGFLKSPVESILDPKNKGKNIEKHLFLFEKSAQKRATLIRLNLLLEKEIKSGALRTDIIGIADELVTNALFNAPFESSTSQGGVSRGTSVDMGAGKTGSLVFGFDDERVVIGCSDPFGSLNLGRLLEKVRDCYDSGVANNMNMEGSKGAGIGSFVVFNLCSSYYVVVENGITTLICCVLPKKMSSAKRAQLLKNVHCMVF